MNDCFFFFSKIINRKQHDVNVGIIIWKLKIISSSTDNVIVEK